MDHPISDECRGHWRADIAISARLDGQATQSWFAEEILEFVDHAAGTTVEIAGRELIREERGNGAKLSRTDNNRKTAITAQNVPFWSLSSRTTPQQH